MPESAANLFPGPEGESPDGNQPPNSGNNAATFESLEELVIKIPGAMIHSIGKERSAELASGDFTVVRLLQEGNVVAAVARVGDKFQWPITRDGAVVKLDDSHYLFTVRVPNDEDKREIGEVGSENQLNYGLTIAAKGQEGLLKELDEMLEQFSTFKVEKLALGEEGWWKEAKDATPEEMAKEGKKKEMLEKKSAAYWTTLAPNVEDYSSWAARAIATGSGHVVKGILWCGDVTVNRLERGDELLKKRMGKAKCSETSPQALRRMKCFYILLLWVKKLTQMLEQLATLILAVVVKLSGFLTSSMANSNLGQKFFIFLPGEIVLASLDGFNKICDAVEFAGKNVMSATGNVTTELVSERLGEAAAKVARQGLDAAGHVIGTVWAVFKIRNALNPKSVMKPSALAKAAALAKFK